MARPNAWTPSIELLVILAIATVILIADALVDVGGDQLPIVVAILVPLVEGLRRRLSDDADARSCGR